MAHVPKDFEGWSYSQNVIPLSSDDEATGSGASAAASPTKRHALPARLQPTRLTRRAKKKTSFRDDPSNIVLRRAKDDVELKIGDCFLYNGTFIFGKHLIKDAENGFDDNGKSNNNDDDDGGLDPLEYAIGMIKKISLHTNHYVEVLAIRLCSKTDLEEIDPHSRVIPQDKHELFLTPLQFDIQLKHVIKNVYVLSRAKYEQQKLKVKSTASKDVYLCQRACDTHYSSEISEVFDFDEILETLFENETRFAQALKTAVFAPMSLPATPTKLKQQVAAGGATSKSNTPTPRRGRPPKSATLSPVKASPSRKASLAKIAAKEKSSLKTKSNAGKKKYVLSLDSDSGEDDQVTNDDEEQPGTSRVSDSGSDDVYVDAKGEDSDVLVLEELDSSFESSSSSDASFELISDNDDFEASAKNLRNSRARRTYRKPKQTSPRKKRKTATTAKKTVSKQKKSIIETTPKIPTRVIELDDEPSDYEIESKPEVKSTAKANSKTGAATAASVAAVAARRKERKTKPKTEVNQIMFKNAKEQFHTSTLLASLPCREEEFAQLYLTLESLINQEMGSCIYISGTPGTGKTATVRKVINELLTRLKHTNRAKELEKEVAENKKKEKRKASRFNGKSKKNSPVGNSKSKSKLKSKNTKNAILVDDSDDSSVVSVVESPEAQLNEMRNKAQEVKSYEYINNFEYVEINGLKLISPSACYELLWEKIGGQRVSANSAKNLIENYLAENESGQEQKDRFPLIILMDEIDQIITKNQSIMYNFFNWPTYNNSKFIVIAIANTMDLPERVLTNKISSRLGLSRLLFPGYTHDQLAKIIETRLESMNKTNQNLGKVLKFEKSAIEFASRKVASVSGDARRGLSICRRAVEIAELEYMNNIKNNNNNNKKTTTISNNNDEDNNVYYVKINHIIKAIQETTNSPIAMYVMNLTLVSKIFLVSILRRQKFTGLLENEINDLAEEMKRIINMNFLNSSNANFKSTLVGDANIFDSFYKNVCSNRGSSNQLMGMTFMVNQLVEAGLITQEDNKANHSKLVKLCLPEDEIYNALRKEKIFQKILG